MADRPDGGHSSTVMTLGPLPYTKMTVKGQLYAADGVPVPAALVTFHFPVNHPEDVEEGGAVEELSTVVLTPDHVAQVSTFLGRLHRLVDA